MSTILTAIVSYVAGLLSGYLVARLWQPKEGQKYNELVLVVVTVVWAISMFYDIVSPAYETSPLVHGLMGAIVGFFYKPQQKV